jgi:hypothetical protein
MIVLSVVYGFPGCFAGMAPKEPTNTGKRKKGEISAPPQPPRNQNFDATRFKTRYHHDRYIELLDNSMWSERVFNISPVGPYKEFAKLFRDQGWDILCNPITDLNAELVREFYANAIPEQPHTDFFTYETFMCGRTISFDRDAINNYLGNPFQIPPPPNEFNDFHLKRRSGY